MKTIYTFYPHQCEDLIIPVKVKKNVTRSLPLFSEETTVYHFIHLEIFQIYSKSYSERLKSFPL